MGEPKRRIKKIGNAVSLKQNKGIVKIPACHDKCSARNLRASSWSVCVCVWEGGGGGGEGGRAMNRGWNREERDATV